MNILCLCFFSGFPANLQKPSGRFQKAWVDGITHPMVSQVSTSKYDMGEKVAPLAVPLLVDAVLTIVDGSFKGQHMRISFDIFEI